MFEFAASSILGAKRFVGVNENQETETLLRQNYTICLLYTSDAADEL